MGFAQSNYGDSSSRGLTEREIHGLEVFGGFLASNPHIASAVTMLKLRAIPAQLADSNEEKQTIYYTDASKLIRLLYTLPRLRHLELTDVVLTGDFQSIAAIIRDLGKGHLSLQHLCINFIAYGQAPLAPGDLRNLLSLFDRLEELRFKDAVHSFPIDMLPFPERLQIANVFMTERCYMGLLFKCLKNLPAIHMLRGLEVGDNIHGAPRIHEASGNTGSFFELLSIVGPGLEHFGAGPETYTVLGTLHSVLIICLWAALTDCACR